MKTNITLKIESRILQEAKIVAAENGTSISAMLAGQLEAIIRERKGYVRARRRAIARMRKGFDLHFPPPVSRNELYRQ